MSNNRYTQEEKDACLAILLTNAGNVLKTARDTGIPRGSIMHWIKESPFVKDVLDIQEHKAINYAWEVYFRAMAKLKKRLDVDDEENPMPTHEILEIAKFAYERQAQGASRLGQVPDTDPATNAKEVSRETRQIFQVYEQTDKTTESTPQPDKPQLTAPLTTDSDPTETLPADSPNTTQSDPQTTPAHARV